MDIFDSPAAGNKLIFYPVVVVISWVVSPQIANYMYAVPVIVSL